MVGEFPELQGVMGQYYALHDCEDAAVASAIEAHYHPRFANDSLPQDNLGAAVALADKLDTLVGIYGIGLVPTGDRDPFGLRRAAPRDLAHPPGARPAAGSPGTVAPRQAQLRLRRAER